MKAVLATFLGDIGMDICINSFILTIDFGGNIGL